MIENLRAFDLINFIWRSVGGDAWTNKRTGIFLWLPTMWLQYCEHSDILIATLHALLFLVSVPVNSLTNQD
jgi:hypothetical protein